MKNLLYSLIILIGSSLSLTAQSFEYFLKSEGVELLAGMAHPTNQFANGSYRTVGSDAIITMNYSGNITTKVRISTFKGWVTAINVISDNDWFPPFLAVELIKDVVYDIAQEEGQQSNKMISGFEQYLNKTFKSFSGQEVASLAMSLEYFFD